jgi:hypothetical protein
VTLAYLFGDRRQPANMLAAISENIGRQCVTVGGNAEGDIGAAALAAWPSSRHRQTSKSGVFIWRQACSCMSLRRVVVGVAA